MRRTAAVVALVTVTVLLGLAAPGFAQDGDTGAAARHLSLEDLSPGGTKPANAPPSVRANGKYGEFVVKYLPTGLFIDESDQSPSWRFMEPGTTIKRNELQLWSKRAYGAADQEYVLRIAHWEKGTRTVTAEDGTTRQEPAAVNVTTYSQTVTFGGGYDYATVELHPHYDDRVRTTMCVQAPEEPNCLQNPGEQRWLFYHASTKASAPIETHSQGGRLAWGYGLLVFPFFGSTIVTLYLGRQFVKAAKAGPQISAIWWVITAVLLGLFVLLAWDWLSDTLVRAPWLISAAVGILLGVIAVEWFGRTTYGAGFLQFRLTEGFDPTNPDADEDALATDGGQGEAQLDTGRPQDAPGVLKARFMVQRFAQGDTGERSAIRTGIRKFWARARGATADLEVDGNMQTRIEVDGPIEELYLLDPEADEPLEYEPERHELSIPDLLEYDEDGNRVAIHPTPYLMGLGALGFSWLAGSALTGSGILGLLVGAVVLIATKVATPVDGHLFARLAPAHYHHAVGAMLTHAQELGNAKAWDDWYESYVESEADKKADKKDLTDRRSQSQMDRLFDRYTQNGTSAKGGEPADD